MYTPLTPRQISCSHLTIYQHHRFLYGTLVIHMALQELLGNVRTQVGGLIPPHMVVIHVDVPQLPQNAHLILA